MHMPHHNVTGNTFDSLATAYVSTPEDSQRETLIKDYVLRDSLKIMRICMGPYGSDYGIRPLSIVARTDGMLHYDALEAVLAFGSALPVSKPLESRFILSPEVLTALNLNLNEIARGVQNCVTGTSHYLHLALVPKIPVKTRGVHDEPGWDVYSMPNNLRLQKLQALQTPLENKVATAEFSTWGNPEMHGDSSEHAIRLYLAARDHEKLAAFPRNYRYKLFIRVDAKAPPRPEHNTSALSSTSHSRVF